MKSPSCDSYILSQQQLAFTDNYPNTQGYLLSIDVMAGKENPVPAKIVCVRNKANRKDWLAFICTDPTLSEEEIS